MHRHDARHNVTSRSYERTDVLTKIWGHCDGKIFHRRNARALRPDSAIRHAKRGIVNAAGESSAAAAAVAYRLRTRDPGADDDTLAAEIIAILTGRGWRPTEARPAPDWKTPRPGPGRDTYRDGLAAVRAELGGGDE